MCIYATEMSKITRTKITCIRQLNRVFQGTLWNSALSTFHFSLFSHVYVCLGTAESRKIYSDCGGGGGQNNSNNNNNTKNGRRINHFNS